MVSADQHPSGLDPALVARAHRAVEPLHAHMYFAPEHDEGFSALGLRPGRMSYFAGRAAPMGAVGAGVVTATFYNFSPSLVAHMIPRAWTLASPEQVVAARWEVARASLTRLLGTEVIDSAEFAELAGLLREACDALTPEGRPLYAGHADLGWPGEPLLDLWHAATLLREYRGDGHIAALVGAGIGGTEAHVLSALAQGIHPPESFGRIHHLPKARLAAVMAGLRERGLVDPDGWFTDAGRATAQRIEDLTDELAAPPYDALSAAERDELVAELEPLTAKLVAAGSR
jgi:hypothetical protein